MLAKHYTLTTARTFGALDHLRLRCSSPCLPPSRCSPDSDSTARAAHYARGHRTVRHSLSPGRTTGQQRAGQYCGRDRPTQSTSRHCPRISRTAATPDTGSGRRTFSPTRSCADVRPSLHSSGSPPPPLPRFEPSQIPSIPAARRLATTSRSLARRVRTICSTYGRRFPISALSS